MPRACSRCLSIRNRRGRLRRAKASWAVVAWAALLLMLLLFGIRNAWDLVTWLAPQTKSGGGQGDPG